MIFRRALPLLALFFAGCASLPLSPRGREVVYTPPGWPEPKEATITVPSQAGLRPAVLLVHGGSWKAPDARWQMSFIAAKLAKRGYVVMNATYRYAPEHRYPAAVDDLREALKWLRAHAAELNVDPARIATWGFSAGGQLAGQVAMLGSGGNSAGSVGPLSVQAAVLAAAPTDLVFGAGGPILVDYLGGTIAQIPDVYREASPIAHVKRNSPPVFQYHGTADTTVSPDHTRRLKAALDAVGVRNEVQWIEGRGHAGAFIFDHGAEERAIDFLDSVLR